MTDAFIEYDLKLERVKVTHTEMGYTVPVSLEGVNPAGCDNIVHEIIVLTTYA